VSEILDLPIVHTRDTPVFVIGAARSGTSILTWLIRRYLKISFGSESQFIIRFYRRLPEYGDLRNDAQLEQLIDDIAKERCFERWAVRFGFMLDRRRVFEQLANGPRGYPQVLNAIFEALAHHHEMHRWGDKTPEYNHDLPVLLSLFPNAQFVHIVRDGRDVALSSFRMPFGAGNAYRAAVDWRLAELRIAHFAASLSADQVSTIRYERMLSNPTQVFANLIDFLGIEKTPEVLSAISADIARQLRQDNCGRWRAGLSTAEQRIYESVAGDQLRAAGYPTFHDNTSRLGTMKRIYWEMDHVVRKSLRQQSWVDQFYRTAVRMRMLAISVRN
jgi:hypothetical protein